MSIPPETPSAPAASAPGRPDGLGHRLRAARARHGDTLLFTGSTVLSQGARFLTFVAAASLLGPSLYGVWNALLLVLTNATLYAHVGVLEAMAREIPANQGRGTEARNAAIADTTLGVVLAATGVTAAACVAASFLPRFAGAAAYGLRVLAVLVLAEQLRVFGEYLLRAHRRFRPLALVLSALGVLTLGGVVAATWLAGFPGFLWSQVAVVALGAVLLWRASPARPRPRLDPALARTLVGVGFPIMATHLAYSVFSSVDRALVGALLGAEQLGFYSLSFMAYGTMMLVPRSVTTIVYPKMALEYGRSRDPRALRELVYRPVRQLTLLMVPLLAAVWLAAPLVVRWLLPQYAPGIPALRILLPGVFLVSLIGGFGNVLNVLDRQRVYLAIQCAAIAALVGLAVTAVRLGHGLEGVAVATLTAQALYAGALWLAADRATRG